MTAPDLKAVGFEVTYKPFPRVGGYVVGAQELPARRNAPRKPEGTPPNEPLGHCDLTEASNSFRCPRVFGAAVLPAPTPHRGIDPLHFLAINAASLPTSPSKYASSASTRSISSLPRPGFDDFRTLPPKSTRT